MKRLLGAVLAGGESKRMGSAKAAVRRADGRSFADVAISALREVCDDVVVLGHGEGCPDDVVRVPDKEPAAGPLSGLCALALASAAEAYLIVPCDLPFLDAAALRALLEGARESSADAAVLALSDDDRLRPLPLYISARSLDVVRERFSQGERRLMDLVASLSPLAVIVSAEHARALQGANTPAELAALDRPLLSEEPFEEPFANHSARRMQVRRLRDGSVRDEIDAVAEEEPLELRVQGASVAVTMRTPGHDEDLATGFLVTERVIERASDITSLRHCSTVPDPEAEENVLDVTLADGVVLDLERLKRNLFASSSCGVCGKATLESALSLAAPLDDDTRVSAELLYALPERLRAAQRVFASTGGLHAAALFDDEGRLLVAREDVGRHNAVDKVVGWALRSSQLANARVLLVSGRVSFEIVQKVVAARVPVVAAISAPSSLAVRLGATMNVTVVGFLRGRSLNVYSAKERVTS